MIRVLIAVLLAAGLPSISAAQVASDPTVRRAVAAYDIGDFGGATALLDAAKPPERRDSAIVELYRGLISFGLADTAKAKTSFRRAIALDPDAVLDEAVHAPSRIMAFSEARSSVLVVAGVTITPTEFRPHLGGETVIEVRLVGNTAGSRVTLDLLRGADRRSVLSTSGQGRFLWNGRVAGQFSGSSEFGRVVPAGDYLLRARVQSPVLRGPIEVQRSVHIEINGAQADAPFGAELKALPQPPKLLPESTYVKRRKKGPLALMAVGLAMMFVGVSAEDEQDRQSRRNHPAFDLGIVAIVGGLLWSSGDAVSPGTTVSIDENISRNQNLLTEFAQQRASIEARNREIASAVIVRIRF